MSNIPSREEVERELELHNRCIAHNYDRSCQWCTRVGLANRILKALFEGVHEASKSHQVDVVQDTMEVLDEAMHAASALYGEKQK